MVTSLYLSNSNIYAVVGSGNGNVKIERVAGMQIPEGSLINGIITNETELAEQLKKFWKENRLPVKRVELVINSSQFILKQLTLPQMKERQLREILPLEFTDVTGMNEPVFDYVEEAGTLEKTKNIHAVMTERSFLQSHIDLFASIGIKISSIRVSRLCLNRTLLSLKQLRDKTCVVLMLDGTMISSYLFSNGNPVYVSQRRVVGEPGTIGFGDRLAQVISNMIQFSSTQHLPQKIREIYLAGIGNEEFQMYSNVIQEMNVDVIPARLDREAHICVKKGSEIVYDNYLPLIGNMLSKAGEMNLVTRLKKKSPAFGKRVKWKKYFTAPTLFLVVFLLITAGMKHVEQDKRRQLRELNAWLVQPEHQQFGEKEALLKEENVQLQQQAEQMLYAEEEMKKYYELTGEIIRQVQNCANAQNVRLELTEYQALSGELHMNVEAEEIQQIHRFLERLELTEYFEKLMYSEYHYLEKEKVFVLSLTGYLVGNNGNQEE